MPLPGETVGPYRIIEQLGVGGSGAVYKAERDGRFFALKFILGRELDDSGEREISILLRLRLPHVVRFVACDRWPDARTGYLFIVMEYVEGRTLQAWAQEENPSALQVVEELLPLAHALGDVHRQGVFHRDVKPENILIRAADGMPTLVDFGGGFLAGARPVAAPGLPPGTPEYQSPQAMGAHVRGERYEPGPTDDFWALGVTLYWLLTDRLPFGTRHEGGLVEGILTRTPLPPHESNPRVPRPLGELCLRMLQKAPEARFPDAESLLAELETLRKGADASWELPLLDSFSPEYTTTGEVPELADPEEDELERELRRWEKHRPRRGKKPEQKAAPAVLQTPAPREEAEVTPLGARVMERLKRPALVVGLLAVLLGAALVVKRSQPVRESVPATISAVRQAPLPVSFDSAPILQVGFVHEVEIPWRPLDSPAGAAPVLGTRTPAPTRTAMLHKDDARLKLMEERPVSRRKKQGLRSLAEKCVGAACCATLAGCPAPQVRPTPASEACPPGAVETMKRLGIDIGERHSAFFPVERTGIITVQEGFTSITLLGPWEQLPSQAVLRGRLIIGEERVYGRFTEAEIPGRETFPVCLELRDGTERGRGVRRRADGGPERARIFSTVDVRAVEKFE